MSLVPSPPPNASGTVRGLVSLVAQTFAGAKTFLATIIASAGIQVASLFNTNGTGSTDVVVKVGTSVADGSVHTSAKLFVLSTGIGGTEVQRLAVATAGLTPGFALTAPGTSGSLSINNSSGTQLSWGASSFVLLDGSNATVAGAVTAVLRGSSGTGATDVGARVGFSTADASVVAGAKPLSVGTGIGGTYVEKFYVDMRGDIYTPVAGGFGRFFGPSGGAAYFQPLSTGALTSYSAATWLLDSNGVTLALSGISEARFTLAGRLDQIGTDSTGTPGAATINKPIGKSAIAAAASSVVITNSLVTATSHIVITPHARDATCKELIAVPAAGSFTVSGSANATAALAFSWEVKGLL